MAVLNFSDKARAMMELRTFLLGLPAVVGTSSFRNNQIISLDARMVGIFDTPGLTLRDFMNEADGFSRTFLNFLIDEANLAIFARREFINGTLRFDHTIDFIAAYFKQKTASSYPEFNDLITAIRLMSPEPTKIGFVDMLNQLTVPARRIPSAMASFIVSPDEMCNIRNPVFNRHAAMASVRPADNPAQGMLDPFVMLGKNAVYIIFRYNNNLEQNAQVDLSCNLNTVTGLAELTASSVKIETVNSIEGVFVPRAVVPGSTADLRPMLHMPTVGGPGDFYVDGEALHSFNFVTGQVRLTVPYAVADQALLPQSYVVVKISGVFLTSGCGINALFSERHYSQRANYVAFPNVLSERRILRTNNGCMDDRPSTALDVAFRAICNKAIVSYRAQGAEAFPPIEASIFNFPQFMHDILDGPINAADAITFSVSRRLAFLRHMYIVSLLLYGLASFSL